MNYVHTFAIINLLTFTYFSYAMEISTPIEKPAHVAFLHNNTVAIAGSNGFVFFDINTKEYMHLRKSTKIDDFAVNSFS